MPRGDGTGSRGQGPKTGEGMGRSEGGRGQGGGFAEGPGGYCVCPKCGERETHQSGAPCNEHKCPKCGSTMTRA